MNSWYEIWLAQDAKPADLYAYLIEEGIEVLDCHHFWDEPWNPGSYVIRLLLAPDTAPTAWPHTTRAIAWNSSQDEQHYGGLWPTVATFFHAASKISTSITADDKLHDKLIHCYLNAQGMSQRDETRWALRFAWNRATIRLRIRWWELRGRRWWTGQGRPAVGEGSIPTS